MIFRNKKEIEELLEWAAEGINNGSKYPGMSYEEGIRDALDWVTGFSDTRPDDDV